jgi:hypothetical protein
MVHFLRNKKNNTIIECEVYTHDLSSVVSILEYSELLLSLPNEKQLEFVNDINELAEIRGWWWEKEEMFGDWDSINEFVAQTFINFSKKWDLYYVTN